MLLTKPLAAKESLRRLMLAYADVCCRQASEEAAKERLRRRLREAGLRPDAIPPHKDSFFLALMKGLQAAGLRPRDYDFREGPVMGSVSQVALKKKASHKKKIGWALLSLSSLVFLSWFLSSPLLSALVC